MPRDSNAEAQGRPLLPPLETADFEEAIYGLHGIFNALDWANGDGIELHMDESDRRKARAYLIAAGQSLCKRLTDQF